ncbi:GNAT family N-acetyltransferase [Microbacterium sp. A196]|uniref:GNAT family N-acetyltransferase n=1 Tax=unclassified Microbacterium TaxID=2609290 RepID=UPI003FCFF41B
MLIRPAALADARGIAAVHVRSWQSAYRGLMPQHVLNALVVEDRAERWRGILTDPHPLTLGTLVAESDGEILGWVSFGAGRDEGADADGEVYGIYSDPRSWSAGVGHALLAAAERALIEAGYRTAFLWVLDGNERADSFYERQGWTTDGATKIEERPELTLREHRRIKPLH